MVHDNTFSIEVRGLVTGYCSKKRKVVVTDGMSASLHAGELTCLLGPNGAGKSTLLKTLTGMLPPLSGEILVDHKPLGSYTPAELSRKIGVVLTDKLMLTNMTVYELISLGRSPYTGFWGRLSAKDRSIVESAINMVGIEPLTHRMIQTLSDGERQKVMIAKALAQETPIIFLDEPTAFLDYPSKVEILQLLLSLSRNSDKTVFLSTHDMELALQIADTVWLMDKVLGVRIGVPEDLALAGELGRYFERPGVRFDMNIGMFRIDGICCGKVAVEGEGSRYHLACKALARIGLIPEHSSGGVAQVRVLDNQFVVNGISCTSIAGMLDTAKDCIIISDKH